MTTEDFFAKPRPQSRIKTAIVGEYFDVWANVILPQVKKRNGVMSYVDLFAGRGIYEDGTPSTPIIILKKAIANPDLCRCLTTEFNDSDRPTADALREAVNGLPGIGNLVHAPIGTSEEVGEKTVDRFAKASLSPTLLFADPFGFKGLSLRLIKAVLKDWGCDCIFFFNYNSINRWITADVVRGHMDLLFGEVIANQLRAKLRTASPADREAAIVDALKTAIRECGIQYSHAFSFEDSRSDRTSHHVVLATKNRTGYLRFKDVTARHSSDIVQGVSSFRFNPNPDSQTSFAFETPLDDLQSMLLHSFAGETLTTKEIHDRHCIDQPYRLPDYRRALRSLEERGLVIANPSIDDRKGLFPDHVRVEFRTEPPKEVK